MPNSNFTCFVCGDDSLVIECCKLIVNIGGGILGILSSDKRVVAYAQENYLQVFTDFISFEEATQTNAFDYLFSISNKNILPNAVIKAPKCLAINYHNAPLPKYAGTYATLWAILNYETQHGVTWHTMSEQVDNGNIVEQLMFPIAPEETMLSLNLKCHGYALESFKHLLNNIVNHKLVVGKPVINAQFYPVNKRVPADGLIDWSASGDDIYTLYRALNTYPFINQIAVPKILVDKNLFIPRQINLLEASSVTDKQFKPGMIVACTENYLDVLSGDQKKIRITKILTAGGEEVAIKDLVKEHDLAIGKSLPLPSQEFKRELYQAAEENFRFETFWVNKLKQMTPSSWLSDNCECSKDLICDCFSFKIDIKQFEIFTRRYFNGSAVRCLMFMTLLTSYRFANYEPLTVGYYSAYLVKKYNNFGGLYSDILPFNLNFDLNGKQIEQVVEEFYQYYLDIKLNQTYKCDVKLRYPSLAHVDLTYNLVVCEDCSEKAVKELVTSHKGPIVATYFDQSRSKVCYCFKTNSEVKQQLMRYCNLLVEHALSWMETILKQPTQPIVELPFLTDHERQWLKGVQDGGSVNIEKDWKISSVIYEQFKKFPDKIALISKGAEYTYKELEAYSNGLARELQDLGIQPQDRVAIGFDNTAHFVIAQIAVMKIGATFVPLDPNYPQTTLNYIVKSSGTKLIVAAPKLKKLLSSMRVKIIYCNQQFLVRNALANLEQYINSPTDISHIIFTSGSTGVPKGVCVTYKNIATSLQGRIDLYHQKTGFPSNSIKMLLLVSTAFDTAVAAIFWPLLCGGQLIMLSAYDLKNFTKIFAAIKEHQITHLICVTSLYTALLEMVATMMPNQKRSLISLRTVIIGGSNCTDRVCDLHRKLTPDAYLFNEYGLTETSICSTTLKIYDPSRESEVVPITLGWPVPGNSLYVLDRYLQQVAVGLAGELYIGGDSVTAGYNNKEELTRQRYIDWNNPERRASERVYKTGDSCTWTENGLAFNGRLDSQIKIRGFRVELEQVATIISRQDTVQQCVVLDRVVNNEHVLVAYIVPKDDSVFDKANLARDLSLLMPHYMLPSFYVILTEFPLTNTHKIDSAKLATYDLTSPDEDEVVKHRLNALEQNLLKIWQEVFGNRKISCSDNFFSLGGHSLLISKLLILIKNEFKISIAIKDFLLNPTILGLEKLIVAKRSGKKLRVVTDNDEEVIDYLREATLSLSDCRSLLQTAEKTVDSNRATLHNVLLTGATGFLGSYLLRELRTHTKHKIYCLVRAASQDLAIRKLHRAISNIDLDIDLSLDSQIVVISADLAQPRFGLSDKMYNRLSEEIDVICHAGAFVHHIYDYRLLRDTNVKSVRSLIEFACNKRRKTIHYISTISTVLETKLSDQKKDGFLKLKNPRFTIPRLSNGYVQTKVVAENLLSQARESLGLTVNIYRPSWILWPSSGNCALQINNQIAYLAIGCKQMGCAPDWNLSLDVWPVDTLAVLIVNTIFDDKWQNQAFNLLNRNVFPWRDLVNRISLLTFSKLEFVPVDKWVEILEQVTQDNPLYSLVGFYCNRHSKSSFNSDVSSQMVRINRQNVDRLLDDKKLSYPKVRERVFDCLIRLIEQTNNISRIDKERVKSLFSLIKIMPGDIYLKDLSGKYVACSDFMLSESKLKIENVVGKTDFDMFPEDVAKRLIANDCEVIRSGNKLVTEEMVDFGTEKRYFQVVKVPLKDKAGRVIGVLGNSLDLNARKSVENIKLRLAERNTQLTTMTYLQQFLEQMVHDMRSPLSSIIMILESSKPFLPDKVRLPLQAAVEAVLVSAQRVVDRCRANLASNIKTVADQISGNVVAELLPHESLPIAFLLMELLDEWKLTVPKIKFVANFQTAQLTAHIYMNEGECRRMLNNIISNSVSALANVERPELTVNLALVGDTAVTISITDNGKGMSTEVIDKIKRQVQVTDGKSNGAGIGYIQINHVLNTNSGRLDIESKVGHGTTIKVTLPLICPPAYWINTLTVDVTQPLVIIDDIKKVLTNWLKTHLEGTSAKNVQFFTKAKTALAALKSSSDQNALLLINYSANEVTDNLHELCKLPAKQRVIVANRYNLRSLRAHAQEWSYQLLPKELVKRSLAKAIKVVGNTSVAADKSRKHKKKETKNSDVPGEAVLIDDSKIFGEALVDLFKSRKKRLRFYPTLSSFYKQLSKLDRKAIILLDNNLSEEVNGIEVAEKLHALGFVHIYLLTGEELQNIQLPPYLKHILKTDMEEVKKIMTLL